MERAIYVDIVGRRQPLTEQREMTYLVLLTTILNLREIREEWLYFNWQGLIERSWTVDILGKKKKTTIRRVLSP